MKQRNKTIILIACLVIAGIALGLSASLWRSSQPTVKRVADTSPNPTAAIQRTGPNSVLVPNYKGKALLVNFWASWCAPCIAEMPSIYQLHERYQEKGFTVLAVNMDEDFNAGLEFLERKVGKPPMPVLQGIGSDFPEVFPVNGLPFTALITKEGIVKYAQPGERDWSSESARKMVEELL